MAIKSYDEFLNEGKPIADTPNLALGRNPINKIPKNSGKLKIGDNVLDKNRQWVGVGTVNSFNKDKTIATVQFYDSLKGSTYGTQRGDKGMDPDLGYYDDKNTGDEIYQIHIKDLITVAATEDNYSYTDEASGIFYPNAVGGASTNTKGQETNKLDYADEDDEDPYNPSIINKSAAQVAGSNVAFVSKNKKTPGSSISTGRSVKEGGLGDNQVAGQRVFTQTVDKSKQGYQDAMYYEEDDDEAGEIGVIDETKDIVCDNCGWSWSLEDAGDDMYKCHKCDNDNTPIDKNYGARMDDLKKITEEHPYDLPPIDKGLTGIDSLVFSNEMRKHNKPELKLEELPLYDPPKNSSEETKRELLYLSSLPQPSKFDLEQDRNFSNTFSKFLKSKGFDVTEKEIHDYSYRIKSMIGMLKNYYNRPRPGQLAKHHKIDIKASDSETAHTPSYPSGHTVQPYAIATALSYKYPNLSDDLFKLSDEIAIGRMRMRLHFPSDYEYGKRLGLHIGQRLKMK